MSISAIIGGQWGDEGKGKVVDLMTENADLVCRYQGGANAGHTVFLNDKKIVLHQIPSGILRNNCQCLLGNGMVIDPIALIEEIEAVENLGIQINQQLIISSNAHIVTPIHKFIDQNNEIDEKDSIGTTCRGIGPAYADKYNRIGIQAIELLNQDKLKEKVLIRLDISITKNEIHINQKEEVLKCIEFFFIAVDKIQKYIKDSHSIIQNNLDSNKNIVIEGAQGTLLDIDHGTYPYLTSSNASATGISSGLGFPAQKIQELVGIFKAYTTRVGKGPFPTELFDEQGVQLHKIGNEFGATTGRPRRCGWFDGVAAKYSVELNGLTSVAITKLDVLDTFDQINVCIGYKADGQTISHMSQVMHMLDKVTPIYKTFEGWKSDTTKIEKFDDFPLKTKNYINYLAKFLKVPIKLVSIGPKRKQIVFM